MRADPLTPTLSPKGRGGKRSASDTVHNGFLALPGWCGASCALPPHPDPLPKGARGKNVLHLIPCIMVFLHCRADVGHRARCPLTPPLSPKGRGGKRSASDTVHNGFLALPG